MSEKSWAIDEAMSALTQHWAKFTITVGTNDA